VVEPLRSASRRRGRGLQAHSLTVQAHAQAGESLHRLWRQARPGFPSSLGPALLPQGLQGQLSCKIRERSCADEKVVRLLCARSGLARAQRRSASRRATVFEKELLTNITRGSNPAGDTSWEPNRSGPCADQAATSKRSRFITLFQAATKSFANFSL